MLRDILSRAAGALHGLAVTLLLLSSLLFFCGTGAPLMSRLMLAAAPPEATGLPGEQYAPVCAMISAYLRGEEETFQYVWTAEDGAQYLLFGEREQLHMADCRELFALCRRILLLSGGLTLLLTLLSLRARRRRLWLRALRHTLLAVLLAAAALGLWGVVDFNTLFVRFHQLFFSNDLWLLDPRTDLLVRLMPTAFFVRYALMILGGWALGMAAAAALAGAAERRERKNS